MTLCMVIRILVLRLGLTIFAVNERKSIVH